MAAEPDAVREAQHARLLEGLAEAIREKGLARVQVADIVRHARASRRTFYKHFADKDACFVELTDAMSGFVLEQLDRAIDREGPVERQVEQALEAYLALLASDPALTRTFTSPPPDERIVAAQREGYEGVARLMVSVLRGDSARDPGLEPVSFERAYMLVAGLHQSILRALAREEDLGPLAAEAKALLKSALGADPARAARPPAAS